MTDETRRDEDDHEEEEEIDESSYKAVQDAVLFAIEVSDSMLTPRPVSDPKKQVKESPTTAAIKCAYHLMQQRIISNPKDVMGVLFYGTEVSKFYDEDANSRGDLSYPHCYLFTDLDVPAAEDVKRLRALVEDEGQARDILVASKERPSMANVLFCANQIFTSKAPNFLSRRLFIVTDNDNPSGTSKSERSSATVRAKDLYDLGVTIDLFPISQPDHDFDSSKFYDDIIYQTSPTEAEAPAYLQPTMKTSNATGDGILLLNLLLSNINSRSVPRRALFSNLHLEFGGNFKISVTGYLLFKRQEPARSCYVWLGGETPQIAKGVTTQIADDTARTVEKWEIRKAYKFGGEQVTLTTAEQVALRSFGDPVIRIIGFKPLSALPFWANVKHPTFIYPSEADYIGSTRVFSALHQKLLKDDKMALVWFIPRRNAKPVVAAMLAGPEKLDDNGAQKFPPGMWIVPLPFADDVRQNPETPLVVAPEPLIDLMRDIIQQLQLPKAQYDPSKYPNPSLQWHYRILQALALDEDLPEKPDDKTVPKYRQIDKRTGEYVLAWANELDAQYRDFMARGPPKISVLAKRPAKALATDGTSHTAKKLKLDSQSELVSVSEEVRRNFEKGTLSKLTVAQLKDFLTLHKRSTAGRKPDLVQRVEEFCELQNW